ncbi:Protein of unknown function, partial [Gryllus bimaculatus]
GGATIRALPGKTSAASSSLLRRCYPSSNAQAPFLPAGRMEDCLPPCYHSAKTMAKLIKEQKRKLFHTSVYESELQLKKLYIQTCKRLPAHSCKVYQVKELLRGKTKKKTARLLGLGPEKIVLLDNKTKFLAKSQKTADLVQFTKITSKIAVIHLNKKIFIAYLDSLYCIKVRYLALIVWRTGGGRSHDRLQLEFRAARWSLVVPSVAAMREVGLALWEILQELDSHFLEEHALVRRLGQ